MNRHIHCRTCDVILVGFGDHDLAELVVWHLRNIHPANVAELHIIERANAQPAMLVPEPVA